MRTPGGSTPAIPRPASSSASSPMADSAAGHEQHVLRTLDGLGGLAPVLLGGDLDGQWSEHPTTLISWLDGEADITPSDPQRWARELGRALALVHAIPSDRLADLPRVFDGRGSQADANGPLAPKVGLAGLRSSAHLTCSPSATTGQATSFGVTERSQASSTGRAQHAVHAATTSAGGALISSSCAASDLLRSFSPPTKPLSARPSATWFSGTAGQPLARTTQSRPGLRTTRRSDAATSTTRSFGNATHAGRHVS